MIGFLPFKKLRRNFRYLVLGAVLMIVVLTVYLEFVASNSWSSSPQYGSWSDVSFQDQSDAERDVLSDYTGSAEAHRIWQTPNKKQPWKPEYKGQANLHIFEDWCGSSTEQLRKYLHYPLYPHTRTTVKKLAVSPKWTNYGLRIFGYLHPYSDGEYQFAVASDDNSEFWLSLDNRPQNLHLLAFVGKTGKEWAAPGEFGKYTSQISHPVQLKATNRYYFEIVHKQNDKGTDHVEVAWRLTHSGLRFTVIDSKSISLYTNESSVLMSEVSHIPQSAASHVWPPGKTRRAPTHGAEMLREDPRDSSFAVPLIDESYLLHVLPDCSYKPTYVIKGFPLLRYQGLQFVHMSYIYPNDYTRLTHMETENKCFYHENPYYLDKFGFFKYMKMDVSENKGFGELGPPDWRNHDFGFADRLKVKAFSDGDEDAFQYEDQKFKEMNPQKDAEKKFKTLPDYGDDYDDYNFKRRRQLFSAAVGTKAAPRTRQRRRKIQVDKQSPARRSRQQDTNPQDVRVAEVRRSNNLSKKKKNDLREESQNLETDLWKQQRNSDVEKGKRGVPMRKSIENITYIDHLEEIKPNSKNVVQLRPKSIQIPLLHFNATQNLSRPTSHASVRHTYNSLWKDHPNSMWDSKRVAGELQRRGSLRKMPPWAVMSEEREGVQEPGRDMERGQNRYDGENLVAQVLEPPHVERDQRAAGDKSPLDIPEPEMDNDRMWLQVADLEGDDADGIEDGMQEIRNPALYDQEVDWQQTFDVKHLDFHILRSDWIDLRCNVSGNLLLDEEEAQAVVEAFMKKLNERHHGRFSMQRVVNVEKRVDGSQGSRYLLELELLGPGERTVRLSQYIYLLNRRSPAQGSPLHSRKEYKQHTRSTEDLLLCNPLGFSWRHSVTVHFIVPVKNQARWVRQFIVDMEELYRDTGDRNFNIIITDYSSIDMDVELALKKSALPQYQYMKLNGNFERSAGLQAGINLIKDNHSIVFLCDLHIHFPRSIIDSIRKHCVEGKMAFAPIVMRLNCGATPQEPDGFWEVNGFGLLGIYKSDLDSAGGMNTMEFRDRWGGEDWELLDRILQAGLEVERIYLRNFLHHYHSKRGMWNRRPLRST
ncbi:beta-1,4-N-acetylgalactosaminyltransferase 3 [Amia ocellicauda]|uniref:beta-1,4-N-acetylgalactosaminyltransferase 3 n=1 Tax=Amia ocellicauda TaxID=2972642 RepID=UPI00346408B4